MPISTNWAYRLIEATPEIDPYIFAHYYEKTNFYKPGWKFLDFGSIQPALYNSFSWNGIDFFYKSVLRILLRKTRQRNLQLLRQNIEGYNIDIVHSHFANLGCEMMEVLKGKKVKHFVSYYGFDYERLPFTRPEYVEKYRQLFEEADGFICEGTHGARTLEKMGCPPSKIHVVRLGIPVDQVQFVNRHKNHNSLKLIQVASMTEKKGHYYTIRAFAEAVKTCPEMSLTLIGSPKMPDDVSIQIDLQEQIRLHRLEAKVKLIDRIDYSFLHQMLAEHDVFIHPSCYTAKRDCEGGAPVVLLDAEATGMPVISTRHCDIPDEVIHGCTGLLSEERDIQSLVENIKQFYLMNNDEFNEYSQRAREHIDLNYNIRMSGHSLLNVYKTLFN
jgi:colanic acid/amylovoran biosynthesis glycosyltransferase